MPPTVSIPASAGPLVTPSLSESNSANHGYAGVDAGVDVGNAGGIEENAAAGKKESLLAYLAAVDRDHVPVPSEYTLLQQARARSGTVPSTSSATNNNILSGGGSSSSGKVRSTTSASGRPSTTLSTSATSRRAGGGAGVGAGAGVSAGGGAVGGGSGSAAMGNGGSSSAELQAALRQQSAEVERLLDARATQQALASQAMKEEYEAVIQRHLHFIDQLIQDKKDLAEKCERLVGELQTMDSTYATRLRALEDRQRHELKKQKDVRKGVGRLLVVLVSVLGTCVIVP